MFITVYKGYDLTKYNEFLIECSSKEYDENVHTHHIIPRFMDGDDSVSNLITLSYHDHALAHLILANCFPKRNKYHYGNLSAVQFVNYWIDDTDLKFKIRRPQSLETIEKIKNTKRSKNCSHSPQTLENIRNAQFEKRYKITQFDLFGNIVRIWFGYREISDFYDKSYCRKVIKCCSGYILHHDNSVWRANESEFNEFPVMSLFKERPKEIQRKVKKIINENQKDKLLAETPIRIETVEEEVIIITERKPKKHSKQTKQKMSDSQRKRWTDDLKKLQSEKFTGRKNPWKSKKQTQQEIEFRFRNIKKPIVQLSLDGQFLKEWESQKQINTELKFDGWSISKVCKGLKEQYNGFRWKFKKDYDALDI